MNPSPNGWEQDQWEEITPAAHVKNHGKIIT